MKVLIDTNVLLDVLAERYPFYIPAKKIIDLCDFKKIKGVMSAHSVTNIFYILRKTFTQSETRDILLDLCSIIKIENIDEDKIISSLKNRNFKDFEDCLQMECAVSSNADYIITRDKKDFANSLIPCLTPDEFCNSF